MNVNTVRSTSRAHTRTQSQQLLGRWTAAYGLSFAITSILSALLVILKETNEDTILAWMKAATGHHWVTHGLIDIVIFLLLGWLLARLGRGIRMSANSLIAVVAGAEILGGLIIAGFYL